MACATGPVRESPNLQPFWRKGTKATGVRKWWRSVRKDGRGPQHLQNVFAHRRQGPAGAPEKGRAQRAAERSSWGKAVLPGRRAAEQVLSWEEAARAQQGRTPSQRPALLWGLIRHQLWSRPRIPASSWGVNPTSPSDLVSPGWEGSGRAASQAQTRAAALLHAALAASQGHTA